MKRWPTPCPFRFVFDFAFAAVHEASGSSGNYIPKKHMAIAKGLLSEDDYLLQEILFNPTAPSQVEYTSGTETTTGDHHQQGCGRRNEEVSDEDQRKN